MVVTLVAVALLLAGTTSYGAEVGGVYTEASTKDIECGVIYAIRWAKNARNPTGTV